MKQETDSELIARIWEKLEENTKTLSTIPPKFQKFNWQNLANLRGAFREGPNHTGRVIDTFSHTRLVGVMWDLCDIERQMNSWFQARNDQVLEWEKKVRDNPPQRVLVKPLTKEQRKHIQQGGHGLQFWRSSP